MRSFFLGPAPTISKPRIKDSSRSTWAIETFMRDDGISTMGCLARVALRTRVSMSAIGSVSTLPSLPARLGDAGDLALQGKLAETNTAQPELPHEGARAPAAMAAVVLLHWKLRRPQCLRD